MIFTRTPLRISIGGGGTDLPSYYERRGGFVISAAINKYVYITINKTFRDGYFLKYSEVEWAGGIDDVRHPIIREALRMFDMPSHLEITSVADVPAGTGLGSSGTFTVGLLHALHAQSHRPTSAEQLAAQAYHLEHDILGEPCGKQDPSIAAYGGLTCQEYHPDGSVTMTPLAIPDVALRDLSDNLLLFFTGYSRTASSLLADQKDKSERNEAEIMAALDFTKDLGYRIREVLESGDTDAFAAMMHEHWERKRGRSTGMSNDRIDEWYALARANGALGGKLVGAGGGGFLLFFARDHERLRRVMRDAGLIEMDFGFDFDGSVVLVRN